MMTAMRFIAESFFFAAALANMNGQPGQYKISNGNPQSKVAFSTDYASEYFDVYSPVIKTQYSEVFWRMMDAVPLPDAIISRFQNKTMAIVGYELNQVMKTSNGEDVSVPITWAYNHHYGAFVLNSKLVTMVKGMATEASIKMGLNHGAAQHWKAVVSPDAPLSIYNEDVPLQTWFSEGNGGEMRLSYHGYPKGYAQLVDSPDTFHIIPMQIDTKNRGQVSPAFQPGPLPKSSQAPPDAKYNGLIECPCSTRLPKVWSMTYGLKNEGTCETAVSNASECYSAVPKVVQADRYNHRTVLDASQPSGCSVMSHIDGTVDVLWNAIEGASCGLGKPLTLVGFVESVLNLTVALQEQDAADAATITIQGPADKWLGVGFGASSMCEHLVSDECPEGGPYAIIITGDRPENVVERKLAFHGPGDVLNRSLTVKSNTVLNGLRTVVVTRPLKGLSEKHYSFDPTKPSWPFINAMGCSLAFAQHCGHAASTMNLLAAEVPSCVCQEGIHGTIGGNPFNGNGCAAFPTSDLKVQANPTCSVETYAGGLQCCRDGQSLLDADQDIPWPGQYLEYHLKFRFYFEDYLPADSARVASHKTLVRLYWQTEAFAGEYDIVKCEPGTPSSQCVQVITSRWKVKDMMDDCPLRHDASCTGAGSKDPEKTAGVKLIYAGPHCHAPHCLSMDLYNADTGSLICHMDAAHGQSDEIFDERGFLSLPPCLWGDEEGLVSPQLLSLDTTLLSIKRNNNTYGHTGEMASWQMRGIVIPRDASSRRFEMPRDEELFVRREEDFGRGLSDIDFVV